MPIVLTKVVKLANGFSSILATDPAFTVTYGRSNIVGLKQEASSQAHARARADEIVE